MRQRVLVAVVVGALSVVGVSCLGAPSGSPPVRDVFDEGVTRDIGVFLPIDADVQILTDIQDLLTQPHPSGRGVALLEGIWGLDAEYATRVLYVEMLPESSIDRRDEIAEILRADPRVERVEVDVLVTFTRDE